MLHDAREGSRRRGGANAPSPRARLLVIAVVLAVILLGGAILLLIRTVGGDEPAPVSVVAAVFLQAAAWKL